MKGPLHVRPDEEPDTTTIEGEGWRLAGGCSFCGCSGHAPTACPNRPISDMARLRKKKPLDTETGKAHT